MAETVKAEDVKKIVFVCEAGMGSSLIGANQLKRKLKAAGLNVKVVHSPVHSVPDDADIVIAHAGLAKRAREAAEHAVVIAFQNFVNNPVYGEIATKLKEGKEISAR